MCQYAIPTLPKKAPCPKSGWMGSSNDSPIQCCSSFDSKMVRSHSSFWCPWKPDPEVLFACHFNSSESESIGFLCTSQKKRNSAAHGCHCHIYCTALAWSPWWRRSPGTGKLFYMCIFPPIHHQGLLPCVFSYSVVVLCHIGALFLYLDTVIYSILAMFCIALCYIVGTA